MKKQKPTDFYEFLPAALEIQETPASPIGRSVIWVIVVFFALTLLWAMLGSIDIVATAQGKIIPNGKSKTIQPLETSVIKNILVKEGQVVKQGDVLIELDARLKLADVNRLTKEKNSSLAKIAKQVFILSKITQPNNDKFQYHHPNGQPSEVSLLQEKMALGRLAELRSRLAQLDSQYKEKAAEKRNVKSQMTKLSLILPILERKANSMKGLSAKQFVSEIEYYETEQQRIETQHDLQSKQHEMAALSERMNEAKQQQAVLQAEFSNQTLAEMAESQQRLKGIEQELKKAQVMANLQTLKSPIDGVVQQLAVNTIGGVVTPAQSLMIIVPNSHQLEVEALLLNKDIGFVTEGQAVEIKIDAFPFTKYGVINGKISTISNDAIEQENLGLAYTTQVIMEENSMNVNGKKVNLSPGMTVMVEVKTGKRKLIEYFLAPLLRYKNESLGER